jgi:hypothetical protein
MRPKKTVLEKDGTMNVDADGRTTLKKDAFNHLS